MTRANLKKQYEEEKAKDKPDQVLLQSIRKSYKNTYEEEIDTE